MGKVTLVGAGTAKDLITVRGLEKIKNADVIVYDDLIDRELLDFRKSDCKLIYVGKRIGKHSENQQTINQILIEQAKKVKNVVRLKGGDSFVFGRGGEEIAALQKENITYEVVPAVTSAVAVPEFFGIPVTHRGVSQSFTVVTGHTATEKEESYEALAKLNGTLVFLMGLHNASYISQKLIESGKDKNTPCAILSQGFSGDGKRINCTLNCLPNAAEKAQTPAIIVVGEVSSFDFSGNEVLPLSSVSVTVTGTKHFVGKLRLALENAGARVKAYPYLEIIPFKAAIPQSFDEFGWIVFTSANGIEVFFEHLRKSKIDLRTLMHLKFACIGKGSADKLFQYGFIADYVPSKYTAEELGKGLAEIAGKEEKVLVLRAENGSSLLNDTLEKAGVNFEDVHIYSAVSDNSEAINCETDYIVFASGSSVEAFFQSGGKLNNTTPVCIGDITAKKLSYYTERQFLTAKEHTAYGIISLLIEQQK